MNKTTNIFSILGYIYITLPILIFFIGWCNPLTAIIGSVSILACLFLACKNAPQIWAPENKKQILFVVSIFFISLAWVYLSGIGALTFQNMDHNVRNPIFESLVTQAWPVHHTYKPAILTYYIGFWLPSAVVGKIFNSIQIGYYFQILWASLGVFLFFYYVLAGLRKKNYLPIILFIFFSGLDFIGAYWTLTPKIATNLISHIEWWARIFQYSSMTTQLFWVFNQAIAAWLLVSMFCIEKNNKNIGFLYSCMFLNSTLPAIGMLPFIAYWTIKNGQKKITFNGFKNALKSMLTVQNILGSLVIITVCYAYLTANISSEVSHINASRNWTLYILWLSIFFFIEAGFYLLTIFPLYKKKLIYYITVLCLIIYPSITIGSSADFCMRGSIPALVVLYLMICNAFESRYFHKKCETAFTILVLALCIGAITPIHEFTRTIYYTSLGVTKQESQLGFENFFGWTENNKFLKYFGKQSK